LHGADVAQGFFLLFATGLELPHNGMHGSPKCFFCFWAGNFLPPSPPKKKRKKEKKERKGFFLPFN